MRKIVSRKEVEKAKERWYGSIRVLADGRVRYSSEPGHVPAMRFSVQRYGSEQPAPDAPERWIYDSTNYGITACRNGLPVLMLFVRGSRVKSACFTYILDPHMLRKAVTDLLKTGNGIERWLAPALKYTHRNLTIMGKNPLLISAIPRILRSLEGIPRADRPTKPGKRKAPSKTPTRTKGH